MPILVKCEKCESQMILREKDGSKFWGCPNWKECGGKTRPYQGSDANTSLDAKNGRKDGFQVIGETLYRIEEKIDALLGEKGIKVEFNESEMPIIKEDKPTDEISVEDIPF